MTFIVWKFKDNQLQIGKLFNSGEYSEESIPVTALDVDILSILEGARVREGIGAVAVATDALGGFSSSRIIVTALNVFAWIANHDIQAIQSSGVADKSAREQTVRKCTFADSFIKPITPAYQGEADITKSKKSSGFTIS